MKKYQFKKQEQHLKYLFGEKAISSRPCSLDVNYCIVEVTKEGRAKAKAYYEEREQYVLHYR